MSKVLVIPVRVAQYNIKKLQKLVDNGKIDALFKPDGKTKINLKSFRHGTRLNSEDIILRGATVYIKKKGKWQICQANLEPELRKYTFHKGYGEPIKNLGKNEDKFVDLNTGREIKLSDNKSKAKKGDVILRNGKPLKRLIPSNRPYKLELGWIVERKIMNGDYVLLNRQPTLHKASMQAMKIVIKPYKTLRFNLAITKPFNADYDFNADFSNFE